MVIPALCFDGRPAGRVQLAEMHHLHMQLHSKPTALTGIRTPLLHAQRRRPHFDQHSLQRVQAVQSAQAGTDRAR